jgi:hypothetical protein
MIHERYIGHRYIYIMNFIHKYTIYSFMKKSPHFQKSKIYDFLRNRLRNIENHIIFKNQLKAILVSKNIIS